MERKTSRKRYLENREVAVPKSTLRWRQDSLSKKMHSDDDTSNLEDLPCPTESETEIDDFDVGEETHMEEDDGTYMDDATAELEGLSSPIENEARTEDFDSEEEYHNEGDDRTYIDDVTAESEGLSSPIENEARTEDFNAEEYHNEGVRHTYQLDITFPY
ncbi:hypothetical protein HOLleu_01872 [Holothuria leucospilota]|uniref:Uncharacterized protein n=1 Tax=Holothuria leucospilota TaxID=206669 RepID=A0A9Q1HL51_HOLLE|nr:hypothetical protein HOLleu_01872 [Holothuria leucospilota]